MKKIITIIIISVFLTQNAEADYLQKYTLRPMASKFTGLTEIRSPEKRINDKRCFSCTIGTAENKTYIDLRINWYSADNIFIESKEGVARIYKKGHQTNSPHLEIAHGGNEIILAYITYDADGKLHRQDEYRCPITAKPDTRRKRQSIGIIEKYAAGIRLLEFVNDISPSGNARRDSILALLQRLKQRHPFLSKIITQGQIGIGPAKFGIAARVQYKVCLVSMLADRLVSPRFFAIIDEHNPSNCVVFEVTDQHIIVLGEETENIAMPSNTKAPIPLSRLKAGKLFYKNLARLELTPLEVDHGANQPYAHTTLVKGISINLSQVLDGSQQRFWITAGGDVEDEQTGDRFTAYLVDSLAVRASIPKSLPTLNEIEQSNGKFISFPAPGYNHPDWLGYPQTGISHYFYKIGTIKEHGKAFVVYQRIDKEDRITAVNISTDRSHYTIEGLEIGGEPVTIEAGHLHLSTFLYILEAIQQGQKETAQESPGHRIHISESLKTLLPDERHLILQGRAKVPYVLKYTEGHGWAAINLTTIYYGLYHENFEVRRRIALNKINLVRDRLEACLAGVVSIKPAPAIEVPTGAVDIRIGNYVTVGFASAA